MKTGKNRQTGNQNPFNPQSSGQGSPYGNAGGTPFGGGMGNAGGAPFGGGSGGFGGGSFGGGMGNAGGTPFGGGSGKYNGQFGYNGMSPMNTRKRTRFSKLFLIVSLIVSVIFFLLGEVIYRTLITGVNSVVFMGVYFALFGLLLSIGLFVVAKISDLEITSNKILLVGGCVLLLLILGILFEFIYELDFSSVRTVADNYVFAIDNSGSMQDNDPNQERVAAIKQLLSNRDEDMEFAVYTFSEDIRCIREMMPVSAGIEDFTTEPNGGTPIVGVLGKIMDDMESGALPYDEGTQVILLTDGYATDNGFFDFRLNKILKKYNSKKVSVSTVGLGSVDENMLNDISGKTGGISVRTDNVDELATAMASAVRVTDTSRNLLSARARTNYNWAYALMRIVFLIILGAGFLGIKLLAVDNTANLGMILISSLIGIVLGALIMEVGLSLILNEFFARLLMTLLFGMMITTLEKTIVETASGNIGVRFM